MGFKGTFYKKVMLHKEKLKMKVKMYVQMWWMRRVYLKNTIGV